MLRVTAFVAAIIFTMTVGCEGPGSKGPEPPAKPVAKYTRPLPPTPTGEAPTNPSDSSATVDSEDGPPGWAQFRGPSMLATNAQASVPIGWDPDTDFLWKSEVLDGVDCRGASSPLVVGGRIYLTAYSGCGTSQQNRGKLADLKHHVICRDQQSGKQIWQRTIQGGPANQRLSEHAFGHGFASSTPLVSGNRLFAFFGTTGVFAFDLDGELLWQIQVGSGVQDFGSSASLTGHNGMLFVNASVEDETLFAIDQSTGQAIWKRDDVIQSWSTPVVAKVDDGYELILSQENWVFGLDPLTGVELWRCQGIEDYVVATPIVVDSIGYFTGGRQHQTMAIRLGGRGDVSATHKLWQIRKGSNVCSLSHYDGVLYAIATNGILQPIDSATGKLLSRQRLGNSKQVLASPTIAGDHMFVPTQTKGVVVVDILDQGEVVAGNDLFDDEAFVASMAAGNRSLFLRSDRHLYRIGQSNASPQSVAAPPAIEDRDVIQPNRDIGLDPDTNRPKAFVRCLVTDPDAILDFMLVPYQSVITPAQTEKSTEYILSNHQYFIDLRRRFDDLRWDYLQGKLEEQEYADSIAEIEELTLQHNLKIRGFIKSMFSESQMDQHLREAGITPVKPGS